MITQEKLEKVFNNNNITRSAFHDICGIITNDYNKAKEQFLKIYNSYSKDKIALFSIKDDYMELCLTNKYYYIWYRPISGIRSYKFGRIIIDKNITDKELEYNVLPKCIYCEKDSFEIF